MELDSYRGSKCFGCLVSAEAHGDDGCQVLLREALSGCGPRAGAAAWQHQGGRKVCGQLEKRRTKRVRGADSLIEGLFPVEFPLLHTPGSSIWLMIQFMAASIPVFPV